MEHGATRPSAPTNKCPNVKAEARGRAQPPRTPVREVDRARMRARGRTGLWPRHTRASTDQLRPTTQQHLRAASDRDHTVRCAGRARPHALDIV